jgi:hypothetical protein
MNRKTHYLVWPAALCLLLLINCGKKSDSAKKSAASETQYFESVSIFPHSPQSFQPLQAKPQLKIKPSPVQQFLCQWWVNGSEVSGVTAMILPISYFKKGDQVQCLCSFIKDGQAAESIKSPIITIQNSPPYVKHLSGGLNSDHSHIQYTIAAADHDQDPITFALISPQDKRIQLNSQSGVVDIFLEKQFLAVLAKQGKTHPESSETPNPDPAIQLPFHEIIIEIRDNDQGTCRQTIHLINSKQPSIPL